MLDLIQSWISWDKKASSFIFRHNSYPSLNFAMQVLTHGGNILGQLVIIPLFWFWGLPILPYITIQFFVQVIIFFLKLSIGRKRPFVQNPGLAHIGRTPWNMSFPSGHTAAATISFLYPLFFKLPFPAVFLFFWLMIVVGFTRMYLRVHYLTDVIAGFLLGIGLFACWVSFLLIS